MSDERRCAFVHSRHCYVEVDNIPLDVCQLCVEAWRIDRELTARETQYGNIAQLQGMRVPAAVTQLQKTQQVLPQKPEADEELRQLDQLFLEDAVDPQEYVRRRTALIDSLESSPHITEPEGALALPESFDDAVPSIRIMTVEKKVGGYKVDKLPGDWEQSELINTGFLNSLFKLTESLPERQKITIQIEATKVAILSYDETGMILLLLDEDESVEDARSEVLKVSPRLDVESISDAFKEYGRVPSKPLSKPLP